MSSYSIDHALHFPYSNNPTICVGYGIPYPIPTVMAPLFYGGYANVDWNPAFFAQDRAAANFAVAPDTTFLGKSDPQTYHNPNIYRSSGSGTSSGTSSQPLNIRSRNSYCDGIP